MTKPLRLADFDRLPPAVRAFAVEGLAGAIDLAAELAPATHRFLRYQWYAAALGAYGGSARTMLVERDGSPVAALPFVGIGPQALRLAAVPGCYWPFRGFPAEQRAGEGVFGALADGLASEVTALRLGPVYDDDAAVQGLIGAMRKRGWAVLDRFVADSFLLDIGAERAAGAWPRNSTLRKNRFHEKHLAELGTLDWRFLDGAVLAAGGFDALAQIEEKSWIAARTDGHDAKFTTGGHGGFWRAASHDPVIAAMLHAALLSVDGVPAAFSFDLNAGTLKYAIANSYDPAFAKHSPGKLLYYRNLVAAAGAGITRVDWGAGDSGYKRVIGATRGPAIRDWLLVRPGLPALAGRLLGRLWSASTRR